MFTGPFQPVAMTKWFFSEGENASGSHFYPVSLVVVIVCVLFLLFFQLLLGFYPY